MFSIHKREAVCFSLVTSGISGWHTYVTLDSRKKMFAFIHITQADFVSNNNVHIWVRAPRIGIDFGKTKKMLGKTFVPNIDVGDLVRLIKVLKHLRRKEIRELFESGDIRQFQVELSPMAELQGFVGGEDDDDDSEDEDGGNQETREFKKRRIIRLTLDGRNTVLFYKHSGWSDFRVQIDFNQKATIELAEGLETALEKYLKLINRWHNSGRLPEEYRHKINK